MCVQTQGNSFFCLQTSKWMIIAYKQLHRAKGTYSWNVCAMMMTIEMHTTWSFHFDVAVKIPLSLGWCIYNKKISSVLKKQNHISQWDWPIAVFCSAFKSFLIVSRLMLCEIWCCLGPKDWSSGRELCQINILCLFVSLCLLCRCF